MNAHSHVDFGVRLAATIDWLPARRDGGARQRRCASATAGGGGWEAAVIALQALPTAAHRSSGTSLRVTAARGGHGGEPWSLTGGRRGWEEWRRGTTTTVAGGVKSCCGRRCRGVEDTWWSVVVGVGARSSGGRPGGCGAGARVETLALRPAQWTGGNTLPVIVRDELICLARWRQHALTT